MNSSSNSKIAVVIPCYKVKSKVLSVLDKIGSEVSQIYVVDDCCPEATGDFVEGKTTDPRVHVVRLEKNLGVGGATMAGYQAALDGGADVAVKIDGDGQMDPSELSRFIKPIVEGRADYTKGNRFFALDSLSEMPRVRLFGNALLSFVTKFSSGYWKIFDPTNGYTAIHTSVLKLLPFHKVSKRYFFESDLLYHLNILDCVVVDIPMRASYADEVSNLKIGKVMPEFAYKHSKNFIKRVFYSYFLRDMSVASMEFLVGVSMVLFGSVYGLTHWSISSSQGEFTSAGTVMLSALPIILGIQFLLAFFSYDMSKGSQVPLHKRL